MERAAARHQKVGVDKTTHDPQTLCVLCKLRIHTDSHGNVGQRTARVNGDLAWVFADLLDQPCCCKLSCKCGIGVALNECPFNDAARIATRGVRSKSLGCVVLWFELQIVSVRMLHNQPGWFPYDSFPRQWSQNRLPSLHQFWRHDQWIIGALVDWYTREVTDLEEGQCMHAALPCPRV